MRSYLITVVGVIQGVRKVEMDGRPQLVLDVVENGKPHVVKLSRTLARELTKCHGRHPLVEEFFRRGEGLQ